MENDKIYFRKADGREFKLSNLRDELSWARTLLWSKQLWKAKDALIDKSSGTTALFIGQKYDSKYFDLIENAWNHDHCDICFAKIEIGDTVYESDSQLVCQFCFVEFIEPKNLDTILW
jgi:hypothetical protein